MEHHNQNSVSVCDGQVFYGSDVMLGNLVFGRRNLWIFPNFHINAFVVEPPLAIWVICAGRKKKTYRKAIIGLIKFASFVPFGAER